MFPKGERGALGESGEQGVPGHYLRLGQSTSCIQEAVWSGKTALSTKSSAPRLSVPICKTGETSPAFVGTIGTSHRVPRARPRKGGFHSAPVTVGCYKKRRGVGGTRIWEHPVLGPKHVQADGEGREELGSLTATDDRDTVRLPTLGPRCPRTSRTGGLSRPDNRPSWTS